MVLENRSVSRNAVYMHATFLILIGFIVLSHWSAGHSLGKMIALQQRGPDSLVEDVMRRDFLSLEANEMLDTGFARIQAAECCVTAPVLLHGELVGLLTADNVNEFLLIVSALGEHRTGRVSA